MHIFIYIIQNTHNRIVVYENFIAAEGDIKTQFPNVCQTSHLLIGALYAQISILYFNI